MKRIICLIVMVMTMLTASVCSAATVAGGNTKYFDRCRVSVNTTGKKVWNYMPALIATVKNLNGTPGKARLKVYTMSGKLVQDIDVYQRREMRPNITADQYIIKIVPLSGSHVVWRIEKNTNAVRSYIFDLTSLKTSTASSTTKKTSSSSKQSGSNPFGFIRVTPR